MNQPDKIGLKKFFKKPKVKWWHWGIIIGLASAGLLGIFYYQGFPSYATCEAPAGFWLWCLFWLYFQFLAPFVIGGLIIAYFIKIISKRKK